VQVFGPPEVRVSFNSEECGPYLGCYERKDNTIHFPPGPIFEYVAAHELGHAIEHWYSGSGVEPITYEEGEGFAKNFEGMYNLTDGGIADFTCDACGNRTLLILSDSSLQCRRCDSVYYIRLYDPQKFKMAYYSGPLDFTPIPTPPGEAVHFTTGFASAVLPAAFFPNKPVAVPVTLATLGAGIVVKELAYDISMEGNPVWGVLRDTAFYMFGAIGGVAALKYAKVT
jgi:hypothetical protein